MGDGNNTKSTSDHSADNYGGNVDYIDGDTRAIPVADADVDRNASALSQITGYDPVNGEPIYGFEGAASPANPYQYLATRSRDPQVFQATERPALADFSGAEQVHILHGIIRKFMGNEVVDDAIAVHVRGKRNAERSRNKSDTRPDTRTD